MADGGNFDPCECINMMNHEARMQRLISMLRESQSYCTDSECFPEGGPPSGNVNPMMWTYVFGLFIFVIVMYLLRPTSRNSFEGKPRSGGHNGGGDQEPVL